MIRYLFWLGCWHAGYAWLCLTGRKYRTPPEWFERTYDRQARAWNRRQWAP